MWELWDTSPGKKCESNPCDTVIGRRVELKVEQPQTLVCSYYLHHLIVLGIHFFRGGEGRRRSRLRRIRGIQFHLYYCICHPTICSVKNMHVIDCFTPSEKPTCSVPA